MELDREMAVYRSKLPELLKKDAGRYVVIHDETVVGVFDTPSQALEAGYERWLFEAFLVKQIIANEKPIRLN
jgi:hypothetical protein